MDPGSFYSLVRHGQPRPAQSRAASAISFANRSTGPYRTSPMTDFRNMRDEATQVAHYNLRIGYLANMGKTIQLLETCAEMKRRGVQPDHTTYDLMLEACTDLAMYPEALAIFEDMVAMGYAPHELTFHHLLKVR